MVAGTAAFIVAQAQFLAIIEFHLANRARNEAARMKGQLTELEATRKSLLGALASAADANRAKSAFLATMSHELRTRSTPVLGFSEAMASEVFGPMSKRYKDYAKDIYNSGTHLLSLISDVLDLSRLDAGHSELHEEIFDLGQLVAEARHMIEGEAAQGGIAISPAIAPCLPLLRADRRRIKQVLLNLLSNALKFTPANGAVAIQAAMTEGHDLLIGVRDSGIGIDAADMPLGVRAFRPG
jgi:signal transduction histidine kinase